MLTCTSGTDQNTENRLKTHSSGGGFGSSSLAGCGASGIFL